MNVKNRFDVNEIRYFASASSLPVFLGGTDDTISTYLVPGRGSKHTANGEVGSLCPKSLEMYKIVPRILVHTLLSHVWLFSFVELCKPQTHKHITGVCKHKCLRRLGLRMRQFESTEKKAGLFTQMCYRDSSVWANSHGVSTPQCFLPGVAQLGSGGKCKPFAYSIRKESLLKGRESISFWKSEIKYKSSRPWNMQVHVHKVKLELIEQICSKNWYPVCVSQLNCSHQINPNDVKLMMLLTPSTRHTVCSALLISCGTSEAEWSRMKKQNIYLNRNFTGFLLSNISRIIFKNATCFPTRGWNPVWHF